MFLWWFWLILLFALLFLPVGYGWGYRGWGPPYPSRFRRREPVGEGPADGGWGFGADLLWIILVVAVVWFVVSLWFIPWGR